MIRLGSAFSGIGGFELGVEQSWPNVETVWQIEKDPFCQRVLKKHWPNTTLFDDIQTVKTDQLEPVDVIIGGFPCQDISKAGKMEGVNEGKKSSLWWNLWRIIGDIRPRIVILENVSNIISVGGSDVLGSLTSIGYDAEWTTFNASDLGAPHRRSRWFCVAYSKTVVDKRSASSNTNCQRFRTPPKIQSRRPAIDAHDIERVSSNTDRQRSQEQSKRRFTMETKIKFERSSGVDDGFGSNQWEKFPTESPLHRRNDGFSHRVDRIRALGNAIVPACSRWVADQVLKSGLLNDLIEDQT